MAFAPLFDRLLKKALRKEMPKYKWETGWSADGVRWKVDVAGIPKDKRPMVLIEIELKKDNPIENIVKIWRWATDEKKTNKIVFLQTFSAHYWKDKVKHGAKVRQRVRAEFIGERMMNDRHLHIRYEPMRIKGWTPGYGKGGDAMRRAAKRLARQIRRRLAKVR